MYEEIREESDDLDCRFILQHNVFEKEYGKYNGSTADSERIML